MFEEAPCKNKPSVMPLSCTRYLSLHKASQTATTANRLCDILFESKCPEVHYTTLWFRALILVGPSFANVDPTIFCRSR